MIERRSHPTSSMQPRTERSRLGNIVRPWNKMNVVEMDVNEDVRVGKELFVKDGVHTNWIKPDKQLTIPAGLLVDTVVGEDAVWSEQVSERVTAFFASFDQTQVFQSVSIGHVKPGKDGTKLYVDGKTILADELDVFGETIVRNAFTSEGETTLGGETFHTTVRGDLTANQNAHVNGDFTANETVTLSQPSKQTTVRGDLTANQNAHVNGDFTANETVTLSQPSKQTTVRGSMEVQGKVELFDTLDVEGNASIKGTVLLGSEQNATEVLGDLTAKTIHSHYLLSDEPIQIPNGIVTKSITGKDIVADDLVSENVTSLSGSHDFLRVFQQVLITDEDPVPSTESSLYVDGTIYCTGEVIEASDAQIKSSFQPLTDSLDTVCKMRGLTFRKPYSADPTKTYLGLVAQEVEEVLPEVVFTDHQNKGRKGVAYGHVVAVLIEAIKELRSTVEDQREQLEALRERFDHL